MYEYISLDGLTILVGTNARENDTLTRSARPTDTWVHSADGPGAHVVTSGTSVETLKDAAVLAAHHSRAKGQKKVSVHVARACHVIPCKQTGQVRVETCELMKTVFMNKELERLKRLLGVRRPVGQVDVKDKDRALLFTNDVPRVYRRKMAFPKHDCDMETGTT